LGCSIQQQVMKIYITTTQQHSLEFFTNVADFVRQILLFYF